MEGELIWKVNIQRGREPGPLLTARISISWLHNTRRGALFCSCTTAPSPGKTSLHLEDLSQTCVMSRHPVEVVRIAVTHQLLSTEAKSSGPRPKVRYPLRRKSGTRGVGLHPASKVQPWTSPFASIKATSKSLAQSMSVTGNGRFIEIAVPNPGWWTVRTCSTGLMSACAAARGGHFTHLPLDLSLC